MASADEGRGAWRVGEHYGIHVYEGDRPVATFHTAEDAWLAVMAVNGLPDDWRAWFEQTREAGLRGPRPDVQRDDPARLREWAKPRAGASPREPSDAVTADDLGELPYYDTSPGPWDWLRRHRG